MTDGDALLRAILERPDDDTARLVYADWLQENPKVPCPHCGGGRSGTWHFAVDCEGRCITCGRRGASGDGLVDDGSRMARAEFIRVGVKIGRIEMVCKSGEVLAHAGGATAFRPRCRCRACSLARREYRASCRFINLEWLVETPPLIHCYHKWSRGFVSEVRLPLAAFMQHAKALFSAHPIERVTLTDRRPLRFTPDAGSASFDWPDVFAWVWPLADGEDAEPHAIPRDLWNFLPRQAYGYRSKRYDTESQALADLSPACVAYGRSLAGLSLLVSA